MSKAVATLDVTVDTMQTLIDNVNLLANLVSLYVMTTDGTGGNTVSGGSVTSGNAYVNGYFSASTIAVNSVLRGGNVSTNAMLKIDTGFTISNTTYIPGNFSTSTNTANQVVDSFSITTYRTAKYVAQVTSTLGQQASEVLMTHNGSASFVTEYSVMTTNGVLGTFTGAANATHSILIFNPTTSANVSNVSFQRTTLPI